MTRHRGTEARRHRRWHGVFGASVPLCLGASVFAIGLSAQQPQAPPARNCVIEIDSMGRFHQVPAATGGTLVFAGGGVLGHCREQRTTLASDSM